MFKLKRSLYEKCPRSMRWLAGVFPYPYVAGKEYRRCITLCRQVDSASRNEVLLLQEELLGKLLTFVAHEVPFYEKYKGVVSRQRPFDALRAFPLISKSTVQNQFEDFFPRSLEEIPHHRATTGGSSGNQLVFLEDDATYAKEMGFMHSQWQRVGYTPRCRKATFRGVQFSKITDSCFWQENPIHNELQFSPFHMNEETLGFYVEQLIRYRPQFIHGYPSAIGTLAEYVLRHDLTGQMPAIRAALLGSETCTQIQRDRIRAAFRTRIFTWYGHSERTVLGGECECSQVYHAFPPYGILEILEDNGEPCDVGEQGEIVGTGFLHRAMPLIRYRTDDYATKEPCECECGRHWDRFSKVIGRWPIEAFVIGKNGSKVSATALNVHGDCFNNVIRYQYYQDTPGQLVIRVIPNPGYSFADEGKIRGAHEKKLWGEMDIVVQAVKDIPLTKSGKQRRLICDIQQVSDNGTINATA